ncbi:MAG: MerR family transcriptional regulator [Thermoguttaceae bacterium]
MNQTMSLKDVSQKLNIQSYRIQYVYVHGLVAEPLQRSSGRRVFMPEDVKRLAEYFKVKLPETEPAMEPAGA